MKCHIRRVERHPDIHDGWDGAFWRNADILSIDKCRPESTSHRPVTRARLAYDDANLHGIFDVHDRYIRCIRTSFQDEVWKDSCVELFVQPPGGEYFNFEFNCGGALYCAHRPIDSSVPALRLTADRGGQIQIVHSLPSIVDPEISQPCNWMLGFSIPLSIFEECLGQRLTLPRSTWKGNLYKCGDETSHPHWLSWSPVPEVNFHRPDCFGELEFV
jgi:hypothetical protein